MSTRNVNSYWGDDESYGIIYPAQPSYNPQCFINSELDTLPTAPTPSYIDSNGNIQPPNGAFPRQKSIMGPTNVKHIYTNIPNWYPFQTMTRPLGSMYDTDTSRFGPHGKRKTYGFQAYPFHHLSVQETREYTDYYLPEPDLLNWTRYPVMKEGTWGR